MGRIRGLPYHDTHRAENPNYDADRAAVEVERRAQGKLAKEAKAVARTRQVEADKLQLAAVREQTSLRARTRGSYNVVAHLNASNSFTDADRTQALLRAIADGESDNLRELYPGYFPEPPASPASPTAAISSPAAGPSSISWSASPSPTHGHGARSPPALVLRAQLRSVSKDLSKAESEVAGLKQKLEEQAIASAAERELSAAARQESPPLPLPASGVRCWV